MENNKNIKSNQPLNVRASQQVIKGNLDNMKNTLQNSTDDIEEKKEGSAFQRRPQFRLKENKRRY